MAKTRATAPITPPLRAVLRLRGIAHGRFAKKIGVSPTLVSLLVHGRRRPSPRFRAAAVEALGIEERLLFNDGAVVAPPGVRSTGERVRWTSVARRTSRAAKR